MRNLHLSDSKTPSRKKNILLREAFIRLFRQTNKVDFKEKLDNFLALLEEKSCPVLK